MAGPASPSLARLVGRLSIGFVLDLAKIGRGPLDFADALIVLTIIQANVAPVTRDPVLQRTYATYDCSPPDDLRRPVSVSAVSGALRMPYETVRRRVLELVQLGICEVTSRGVIVRGAVLDSPVHREMVDATYARIRTFYWRMRELGLFEDVAVTALGLPPFTFPSPPVRAVTRLSSDFFLRTVEALRRQIGHVAAGLLLLDIVRANTEHLSDDERGADGQDVEDMVPDDKRRPVRSAALAERLGLPQETTRRHVAQLIKDGRCVRVPGGLIIPATVLANGVLPSTLLENLGHLHRMFSGLAQLGILAEWERERDTLRGVA